MLKKNRGFTLIELIIVIALSGIIFLALVMVSQLTYKINNNANELTQAQNLAQKKMQVIKSELHYANYLNILTTSPVTPDEEYAYIYVDNGKIEIMYSKNNAKAITSDSGFDEYNYTLNFKPVNTQVIQVDLTIIKDGKQLYSVNSKVYLNNLLSNNIIGAEEGSCIAYYVPGISVNTITVSSPSNSISVNGQTLQMDASVYPLKASNKGVAWSVDNFDYASITQEGLLTPLKNGIVVVKATALDGSAVYGTKQIIISNQNVTATALTLSTQTGVQTLKRYGYTLQIIANITPSDTTNKNLTWRVSKTNYATIDQNGILTSKSTRNKSVVVTATTKDGSNIKGTIEIYLID